MSSRYVLRGRKAAGSATNIPIPIVPAISGASQAADEDRRVVCSDSEADIRHSYSEVVASRPLTPRLPGEVGVSLTPVVDSEVGVSGPEGKPQLTSTLLK